jgi:hypothetical protein
MKQQNIRLRRRDVEKVLRDLNVLVVSFDRLGSAFCDNPARHAVEMDKFLRDVFAFKILAKARTILCVAYESQLGRAEMERFEERLEKLKVWGEKGFRGREK